MNRKGDKKEPLRFFLSKYLKAKRYVLIKRC